MKRFFYQTFVLAIALTMNAAPVYPEEKSKVATIPLEIKGMICVKCEAPVRRAIKKLDGVSEVVVDRLNGKAWVSYDASKVTAQQMIKAVNKTGYQAKIKQQ